MIFLFLLHIIWAVSADLLAGKLLGNETDKLSLLEFKDNIHGDPLGVLTSWNESFHFCSWPGVTCSRRHEQRVTHLDVSSSQLKGHLSPHIGNLSFLRSLNLSYNSLDLEIPPEIGRLFRLRNFELGYNNFSGEIPENISGCSNLSILSLFANSFSGRIPEAIGLLSGLRRVGLSRNKLVGEIPAVIGNLSSLEEFRISLNKLHGTIPYSLGKLKNLKDLVLAQNSLTGTIPLSLYNASIMEYFSVRDNQLKGSLPPDLGHTLPNLQILYLDSNNFSGPIPATLSNASNLYNLQINDNNFIGKVPSFTSSLNLGRLQLTDNNLGYARNDDFDFLNDLSNSSKYVGVLELGSNNFGGTIPETISNMTWLSVLGLGENKISGNIPTGIGNLVNLERFGLQFNHMTGPIPSSIGKLTKLYVLLLSYNQLSGFIPSSMQNLTLLSRLALGSNRIQGNIPPGLGECINLQELSLAENNLSGPIPIQLLSLSSLSINLDLYRNQLSGEIPIEVGKLVRLGRLDVSKNQLSGEIPKSIGSCTSMEYLYLEGNRLEGSIPEELKNLRGLEVLDLSSNNLSGKIPDYFTDFRVFVYLNFSFNDFEGQVPQKGVFKNVNQFSITGNTRLCGGLPELKLPTCSNVYQNHKLSPKIKLVIIISCAFVGFIIFLLLAIHVCCTKKRGKTIMEPLVGKSLPRVSYGDLSNATDGFSSENLIGVGNFGSVYKGLLNQEDTLVAVKVLNLQVSRALNSFIAECESLRVIKHRNLVKILTVCSGIDFQGNDFRALVYEFMENGSLEEWLHSSQSQGQSQNRSLNLIQRVSIAGAVAGALDYLHNHCTESIAHCDIKPGNILLDANMVAHVGDFGLAKLLKSAFSNSSNQTSSIGIRGTVGYVAPEYVMGSEVSTLGDIYSFGILLLEMFTGKRPTDSMFKDDFNLHNFASAALPECVSEVVDPMLLEAEHVWDDLAQVVKKSLVSIIEIGVSCSSKFPRERRNIGDVAAELGRIRDNLNAQIITPLNLIRIA